MNKDNKVIKSPIFWGVGVTIIVALLFVVYQYEQTKEITERARKANEEWAYYQKFPWKKLELNSDKDLQIGNMQISNSDLTPEEKQKESIELWVRYHQKQQIK